MSRLSTSLVLLVGLCRPGYAAPDEPPGQEVRPIQLPRSDRHGDPLPSGAAARLGTVRLRHGFNADGIALAPDGHTLVSACHDDGGNLVVWDAATGRKRRGLGQHRGAYAVAVSPDGQVVAS